MMLTDTNYSNEHECGQNRRIKTSPVPSVFVHSRYDFTLDAADPIKLRSGNIRVIRAIRGFCPPPVAPESRDCGAKTGGFSPPKKVKIYY